jgi:hypothetical protein
MMEEVTRLSAALAERMRELRADPTGPAAGAAVRAIPGSGAPAHGDSDTGNTDRCAVLRQKPRVSRPSEARASEEPGTRKACDAAR